MKTTSYNPSKLEVGMAEAIVELKSEVEKWLMGCTIIKMDNNIHKDNPLIKIHLKDKDEDPHQIVIKIIQTPDSF